MGKLRGVVASVTLTVVLCAGAAACSPEPGRVVTSTPSVTVATPVSATASPSPSPTRLSSAELLALLPEGADLDDVQGAVITAEFFVEQYGVMLQTGDTRVWDALSGEGCAFCEDSSQTAAAYLAAGTKFEGGEVSVDTSRTRGNLNDDGFTYVGVVAMQDDVSLTKLGSTEPVVTAGEDTGLILKMSLEDGLWIVSGAQIVDPSEVS